jgi:hypothetical protein
MIACPGAAGLVTLRLLGVADYRNSEYSFVTSRLRRLVLSDRYFFVTCNLLRTRAVLNEDGFEILLTCLLLLCASVSLGLMQSIFSHLLSARWRRQVSFGKRRRWPRRDKPRARRLHDGYPDRPFAFNGSVARLSVTSVHWSAMLSF